MADDAKEVKDYTGQGTGTEEITVIDTEDALKEYLEKGGAPAQAGKNGATQEGATGTPAAAPGEKKKVITDPKDPNFKIPETLGEEEEGGEEEEEEFTNMVDYLDKEFDLGLNIKELPAEMTREQEAETIAGLFRRMGDGFHAQLNEFSSLAAQLKDPEVALFLQAKREGKTLKDIAVQYNTAPASAPDDIVVSRHIKAMYPTMTDAEIQEEVKELREKNRLDKRAAAAREFFKAQDAAEVTRKEEERQKEAEKAEQEYAESVNTFGRFLQSTNKVYDVTITPEMKKRVFAAVTHRDAEGITEHDRVLQSEAGTFLSALGIYYMKELLRNRVSEKANKGKKSFVDRLTADPSKLQSGSEAQPEPDFNPELANQF